MTRHCYAFVLPQHDPRILPALKHSRGAGVVGGGSAIPEGRITTAQSRRSIPRTFTTELIVVEPTLTAQPCPLPAVMVITVVGCSPPLVYNYNLLWACGRYAQTTGVQHRCHHTPRSPEQLPG